MYLQWLFWASWSLFAATRRNAMFTSTTFVGAPFRHFGPIPWPERSLTMAARPKPQHERDLSYCVTQCQWRKAVAQMLAVSSTQWELQL